jgi:hypothetical protein
MPTMAVDQPSAPAQASPAAVPLPPPHIYDEPPRKSRFVPALLSFLVVSAVGAVFLYQSGLVGQQTKSTQQPVPQTEAPKPEPVTSPPASAPATDDAAKLSPSPTENAKPESAEDAAPAAVEPVPAEKPSPLRVSLPPGPSLSAGRPALQDIWVTSNPPGAKAVIDGNLTADCRTPCMLHALPGRHSIAVSQAGYLNEYREVTVGDTAIDVPQITLRQPMGTLFLTTQPAGASIRVDGQPFAKVTPAELTLSPGAHTITVERGGITKTEHIKLGDSLVRLSVPLEP